MELMNEIGFMNFWGVTPSFDLLSTTKRENQQTINILISDSNDIRHIIKTVYMNYISKTPISINFYMFERNKENIARALLHLFILNDTKVSIRDRIEIFLETYGNTLIMARTSEYLSQTGKLLNKFVTQDSKFKCPLHELIDFSNLLYREVDELSSIFQIWDTNFKYDIQKYRDDRLRFKYKERYDYKDNLVDWDHQMTMIKFAPIVRGKHYLQFRNTGISFQPRMANYSIPNKTLASYIEGQKKTNKDGCLVLGFWGDIVNSPYIGFGVETDNEIEHDHFYKNDTIQYKFDSQDLSEYNLLKYFYRLELDEIYDFMTKKSEGETEESDNSKTVNDKLVKNIEEDMKKIEISDKLDDPRKLLQGFKNSKFEVKIILLSGDLDNISKKKKFKNIFDIISIGFLSKNVLSSLSNLIKNEDSDIFIESNSHMTSFKDDDKTKFNESFINLAFKNGLKRNENFKIPYMNKYHYHHDLKNNEIKSI